jgi:hypothetical protein
MNKVGLAKTQKSLKETNLGDTFPISYISLEPGKSTRFILKVPYMLPHGYAVNLPPSVILINHGHCLKPFVICPLKKKYRHGGRTKPSEQVEQPLSILCLPYSYGASSGYYCVFYRNNIYERTQVILREQPGEYGYLFE